MDDYAISPGPAVTLWVDGRAIEARLGQTVGTALLAQGVRVLRHTRNQGKPRGLFCAVGICYDCVLTVNGKPGMRACMTYVEPGMNVSLPRKPDGDRVP
ncbi:MAG: (2Fe-2S)-binding protein [Burkholderiales bacterium]|nr:(2Fe-2S)-binding protein [Burkholderiales bacterium]